MVVEDEDAIRTLTRRILTRQGYEVDRRRVPADALALCADQSRRPDLLLTDVVMPGMSGKELSDRLRELQPGLRVLFMSGYTRQRHGPLRARRSGDALLQKPFNGQQLLAAVRTCSGGASVRASPSSLAGRGTLAAASRTGRRRILLPRRVRDPRWPP